MRIWFMPTGWRPADVQAKFPIQIEGVHTRKKYDSDASTFLKAWSWVQLGVTNLLMYFLLVQFATFDAIEIVWYAIFLFVSIFSYTTLMDRHVFAIPAEVLKLAIGFLIIYQNGGWFTMDNVMGGASILMIGYLVVSMALTFYFTIFERVEENEEVQVSGDRVVQ